MTTAALEKGQVITVSAIVQGYESKDGRERVLLDIASFHAQHDTKVDVTPEQKLAMPAGVAVNLTLRRENMSSEKYKDRPYGWYYGLEGIGGTSAGPEPAPAPSPEQRKAAALAPDPRGNSIERQVALIQANLLAINGVLVPEEGKGLLDTIEGAANSFIAWLQGTTAPDTDRTQGAGEPEPDIDETQAPTNVDDLPF